MVARPGTATRRTAPRGRTLLTGLALGLALTACATGSGAPGAPLPSGSTTIVSSAEPTPVRRADAADAGADARWADSVLATLSLRDKAARMVWPWILGDYTA